MTASEMGCTNLDIPAPIHYVRSSRARRLRITIRPEPSVTVTIPRRVSLDQARRFAASREDWIRKHLRRMAEEQHRQPSFPDLSALDLVKAQDELFARLEAFSRQYDLPYRRVSFRCQKTRWGSCSSRDTLSLNIQLVFLPRHLQDYVLLHELTHVRHKHHGPAFWAELGRLCGQDPKALSRELRQYRLPRGKPSSGGKA